MESKSYQLRYLPLFEQDLKDTVNYISNTLKNKEAALRLVDDIETAILNRLSNPTSFEPYHSKKKKRISLLQNLCTKLCNLLCSNRKCNGS